MELDCNNEDWRDLTGITRMKWLLSYQKMNNSLKGEQQGKIFFHIFTKVEHLPISYTHR